MPFHRLRKGSQISGNGTAQVTITVQSLVGSQDKAWKVGIVAHQWLRIWAVSNSSGIEMTQRISCIQAYAMEHASSGTVSWGRPENLYRL